MCIAMAGSAPFGQKSWMRFILHIHDALLRSGSAPDIGAYTQVCRFLIPLAGAQPGLAKGFICTMWMNAATSVRQCTMRARAAASMGISITRADVVYWQRGDLAAALDSLSQGLTRDPRHPGLLENAARILFELGQREDAEILCKRYLDIDPGNSDMAALLLKIAAEP